MTKQLSFEEAIQRLDKIVAGLEDGDLTLEGSLKAYEEGVKLAAFLQKQLESAEKKIEVLKKNATGSFDTAPFDLEGSESSPAKPKPAARKKKPVASEDDLLI